jgi:superkiller protein 3
MKRIAALLILVIAVMSTGFAQAADDPQVIADQLFNEGNAFMRAGNLTAAITKYNEALELVKDHRYYYQKAIALLRVQRFEDSIAAFNDAVDHGSDMETVQIGLAGAYMGRGEELFSAGNYSGAITQYRRAIEISPDPRYYNRLAIALRRDNQDREAVQAFRQAIELDPQYSVAFVGLGSAYLSLQRYDDAIDAYTKAREIDTSIRQAAIGLATAYTAKGNEMLNQGQVRGAIDVLENAIVANPNHSQAYLLLAVANNRIDRPQEAEQNARLAIQHKQRGQQGAEYFELGVALKKQGRTNDAIRAFQEAAKDSRYRRNAEYELEELRSRR